MIDLSNFRIVRLDKYNMTFEEYKEVENPKTKERSVKWIKVGGYYGNIEQCLKGLKDYIISSKINAESLDSILAILEKVNNSYVNCKISAVEV